MTVLADAVSVDGRFARSANLERDAARPEPLDGYVLTAKGIEVFERIAGTAATGPAGGAWTLTGPYGSGKSSLGLLLNAAFSGDSPLRRRAEGLIDDASPSTADLVRRAHRRHRTSRRGFNRGIVTATREPLAHTVARALHCAAHCTDPPPRRLRRPVQAGSFLTL